MPKGTYVKNSDKAPGTVLCFLLLQTIICGGMEKTTKNDFSFTVTILLLHIFPFMQFCFSDLSMF